MTVSPNSVPADVIIVGRAWDGQLQGGEARSFWYFGNDYVRFQLLCARLSSPVRQVSVGDVLNHVAVRLRSAVIDSDTYLASGRFSTSWLASDVAEPNPYVCDFYLDLCRGVALVEAARRGEKPLVAVDDDDLRRALAEVCRRAGFTVSCEGKHRRTATWRRAIRSNAGFIRAWLREQFAVMRHPAALGSLANVDLWFLTWAGVDTFPADAPLMRDRFFGLAPSWMGDAGWRAGFLANPLTWVAPIEKIARGAAQSVTPAMMTGRFFGLAALVRAYVSYFAFPFAIRRRLNLEGVDLSPLVRLALTRVMASSRLLYAALFSSLARGMKAKRLFPKVLIYTYENQPWEKTMLAGFRSALPDTIKIGVQHAPIAEYFLSGHPSVQQWKNGSAPDLLVTIGDEFKDRLISAGVPSAKLAVGGAVRHPKLFESSPAGRDREHGLRKMVLASCPADIGQAVELIHKGAEAVSDLKDIEFVANFHPHTGTAFKDLVREKLSLLGFGNVSFVEGGAAEWLERADILLYNSSTTCFEAAAAGVPAIYVGPSIGLDLDNMPHDYPLRGRTSASLKALIERILADDEFVRRQLEGARAHFRHCISQPTPAMWAGIAEQAAAMVAAKGRAHLPRPELAS